MAAGYVVLLADLENIINGISHHRVLVFTRMPELLAQIAFSNQDDADTGHFLENSWQVVDGACLLALDNDKNFSVWREGPNIGAAIIFLLCQAPVARRT